ncbi:MAG: transcriptional regulator, TetR family [Mycobacterium sp.]|jgi:AcrR family transcriptional regulator|nr:transcriptional regulator, TetR family [Mycobacterium sp.]
MRIAHMLNLYRYRGMFGLSSSAQTPASLAIAMQLMLFPETPAAVIAESVPAAMESNLSAPTADWIAVSTAAEPEPSNVSPVRQDVLSASSALFAERGYYSVAMEDIAAAACVSRATLYRHFSTKVKILVELTGWTVVEGEHIAADLHQLAEKDLDPHALHTWMGRYVRFHRSYGGVIRAWYDGTLAEARAADPVTQGMGAFHVAVSAYLNRVALPAGLDPAVAAAVFLAVLGRMTELSVARHREDSDYDAAGLMMLVLQRALHGLAEADDGRRP